MLTYAKDTWQKQGVHAHVLVYQVTRACSHSEYTERNDTVFIFSILYTALRLYH